MKIQTLTMNRWGRAGNATEGLLHWDQYHGLRDRGYGSCFLPRDCKSRAAAEGTDGSTTSLVLLISDQVLACFANHLIFKTEKITQGLTSLEFFLIQQRSVGQCYKVTGARR